MKKPPLRIVPFLGGQSIKDVMPGLFAPSGTHMFYFGGPVISNVHIVQVLYGTGNYLSNVSSTVAPSVASFFTDVTHSFYFDLLSEYSTEAVVPTDGGPSSNQPIGHGFFDGQFTIIPSAANSGSILTDDKIQAELLAQVTAGKLPAPVLDAQGNNNTIYMVYFPQGVTITLGQGVTSCARGGFCAYHNSTTGTFSSHSLYYGVLPDMQAPSGCSTGCGSTIPFDNVTIVSSHELAEAVSDADVGQATANARPLAWFDPNTGAEIGDVCTGLPATININSNTYSVQQEWSNLQDMCTGGPLTFGFGPPFFVTPGTSFTMTVSTSPNYRGTVHFTSSDITAVLPADYTYTFADAGIHTFVATLNKTGNQTITAKDTIFPFTGTWSAQVQAPPSAARFVISAPANANVGSPVSITLKAVDSAFNPTPSYNGTVQFTSTDSAAVLPANTQVINGTATFSVTLNTAGPESVNISDVGTPSIAGQASFNVFTVGASSTTTTLTASLNPSTYGQPVVYTATVTGGTPPLTGGVNILGSGVGLLDANGQVQTTLLLGPGTRVLFADYSGSSTPSSSAPFTAVVNPAPTTVNLSASQSAGNLGDPVTFTATLSSALTASLVTAIPQSGSITVSDGGTPLAILFAPPINNTAGTTFTTTQLTTGQHTITATFSGNTGFATATSAPLTQVVNPAGSPDYSMTSAATSASVLSGQTANFVISTQSLNGFTGTIKFSCANLPAFTTCSFSPSLEFLVTAGNGFTTLGVKTTGPHAALVSPGLPGRSRRMYALLAISPFACGMLLLPAFRRKRTVQLLALVAVLGAFALVGCGGGGGSTTPATAPAPAVTPSGTTAFSVIATATPGSGPAITTTKQLNLTLTVQ